VAIVEVGKINELLPVIEVPTGNVMTMVENGKASTIPDHQGSGLKCIPHCQTCQ